MTRPDRLRWVRRRPIAPVGPSHAVSTLDGLEHRQRPSTTFAET
ncbi:MAG TPA: hypothetical protein VH573_09935 [Mycobacteriales bacterium]|jgi:hypothetical protein